MGRKIMMYVMTAGGRISRLVVLPHKKRYCGTMLLHLL